MLPVTSIAIRRTSGLGEELSCLARLALPNVATQLLAILPNLIDIAMLARLGTRALAAAELGHVCVIGTLIVANGVVLGVDPIISQSFGAGDRDRIAATLQRGIVLAMLLGALLSLSWLAVEPVLVAGGQERELAAVARAYMWAQIPGIFGYLVFAVLRSYLQGRGIAAPATWILLLGNGVNIAGNWLFIYGNLGCPRLGVAGAGLATGIARVFMALALAAWIPLFGLHRGFWRPWRRAAFARSGLAEILRYGLPTGLQYGLEVWAFSIAGLLAGLIGTDALASNALVLNASSCSFMVPLGISIAAAARVGNLVGARDGPGAQRAAWAALALGGGVMSVSAVFFALAPGAVIGVFQPEPPVWALTAAVLPVAAAFQVFDGTQVVGGGVLRGMGTTRPAAFFNLIAYYVVGLPLGWWLATERGLGLTGIWSGLAVGLAVSAALCVAWIARRGPASQAYAGASARAADAPQAAAGSDASCASAPHRSRNRSLPVPPK
jgi:MATE family multidrug resistance protein